MPHPQGTCVLLEVNTLNELIDYFQGLYQNSNVLFELKGVHINEKQCDMTDISDQQLSAVPLEANHADAEITTIHIPLLCCCATSFYSICFSIIKYGGYWNSQTLDSITDHANKFYKEKLNGDNHPLTINNFPRAFQIYDADISIAFNLKKQYHAVHVLLYTAFQSKIREGSYYICSLCNRIQYRKTVIQLKNKCTTLSNNYLLRPMIPYCLGMTYHLVTTFFGIGLCP